MNELLVKLNEVLEKSKEEARYLRSENKELKDHIKHLEMARILSYHIVKDIVRLDREVSKKHG